jgi:hypothetical protein
MSTTTHNRGDTMSRLYRKRWFMPAFALFLGVLFLIAFWIGDEPGEGVASLGVMTLTGALFYFGGRRSETIAGIGGPARDERWERIDVHATALTGMVLITVIIGAFLVEVAQGKDGTPWSQLGALGGVVYIAAVALLRWRS